MNSLALRGIWLALEAWPEAPPGLVWIENVPRITTRSREWLDQLTALLHAYGYAVQETTHDCGELGGLAQHRRRFLLVARHMTTVPEFLYVPPTRRVRGIGEVIGELPVPLPGSSEGGPMHRLPRLSLLNWVRLALIPAGGDWRDLPPAVALAERSARQNGGFGVEGWDVPAHAVIAEGTVRNTRASVADPRLSESSDRHSGKYGPQSWDDPAHTVIAESRTGKAWADIADPRSTCPRREGSIGVRGWSDASHAITGTGSLQNHSFQTADPRLEHEPRRGTHGMQGWAQPSHVIIGGSRSQKGDNVADPRVPMLVGGHLDLDSKRPTHVVIRAADGTWHRPLTTLELAVLQGFPAWHSGGWLVLPGNQSIQRMLVGNAVPPPAAEAIARSCAATLRASSDGVLLMSADAVWVDRAGHAGT